MRPPAAPRGVCEAYAHAVHSSVPACCHVVWSSHLNLNQSSSPATTPTWIGPAPHPTVHATAPHVCASCPATFACRFVTTRTRIERFAKQILEDGTYRDPRTRAGASAAATTSSARSAAPSAVGAAAVTGTGQRLELLDPRAAETHYNSLSARPARKLAGKKRSRRAVGSSVGVSVAGQAPPAGSPHVLVWLRRDLRVHDNPALVAAAKAASLAGGTVTVVYIHSPEVSGGGVAGWGWLLGRHVDGWQVVG